MRNINNATSERENRRKFMKKTLLAATGFSAGKLMLNGCSSSKQAGMTGVDRNITLEKHSRSLIRKEKSILSFVTGNDSRDAAYQSLKPLEETVARSVQGKQVVIKPNTGVVGPQHHHEVADVNQLRGILDFLKPLHAGQVIIAEGTAAQAVSMFYGFEEYGYTALEQEYNVRLVDANDLTTTTQWILAGYHRPQPINIINLYIDPKVYLISACRLKTSGGVLVTLSIKNITMGAPKSHYKRNKNGKPDDLRKLTVPRGINEKVKMHGGIGNKPGRELSYNIFSVAEMGVYADLAVLDGVYGADGNGPWSADPLEHGVAVASNDCVAADRLGSELMGVDYNYLPYIKWCAQAGIGRDDLNEVDYRGPYYKPFIKKYRLNRNFERQIEWIHELKENLSP